MKCDPTFSEFLQASLKAWSQKRSDDFVLSLALSVQDVDPLVQLPVIANKQQFSFLWDRTPGLCIAAAGKCQNFELVGPRRFELAQRFSNETLGRLIDGSPDTPSHSKPKVLLAFTFFEQTSEIKIDTNIIPAVQAILPSWQLSRQSGHTWLRLNSVISNAADVRTCAEQLWLMRESVVLNIDPTIPSFAQANGGIPISQNWQKNYRSALQKGIEIVNSGELKKLVLAVKKSVVLQEPLKPLLLLANLRNRQPGSCRFLWKRSQNESFFGASPERLLSVRQGQISTDALAGTALLKDGDALLSSEKDLREHELVVTSILTQMSNYGLKPYRSRSPRLAKHGHLVHLHTPITAISHTTLPLQLAEVLHPTPAVAGLPRTNAVKWLRALESFERGNYAAPVGWVDLAGNCEFRVAIRCGYLRGLKLDLIAGAGLVRGSIVEKELEEVRIKLAVMADQILSKAEFSRKTFK
ncbi:MULTISPECIES: isochorismate synthase [Prochlorococcus]|uniref:isochorismate synthase n=1 Tax=Prochlorococcus TaxID=1218 RepID=UPI0005336ED1|nr:MULTISPECIES: isochorismate synthase [Prochlorococcus]KGG13195.1 Isochorismate synthase Menaquinone-specific isochorismate synthase [Prochlorococcus sp. MIT 0601]